MVGQALGLPTTMTFYSFIGIAVTSATVVIFGQAIWDPVAVLARLESPIAVVVAMVALLMATLNVNVAANVVSPANDFSNLWPRRISFRTGGLITCLIGVLMQPWKLLANYGNYVSGWLVGYSGFLGPVAGDSDLRLFRAPQENSECRGSVSARRTLRIFARNELESHPGAGGWMRGGVRGLVCAPLRVLYDYAWFVGFGVSFVVYWALTNRRVGKTSAR